MTVARRALAEGVAAAAAGYVLAVTIEAAAIIWVNPSEWELAWVSDVALAGALGTAVYVWRRLLATRHELADRERAELVLQAQLSIAADIQRRLLPRLPAPDEGLECAATLRPAGKIGGDFYDLIRTAPGTWTVLVSDVSGKGIPAALALGMLRSTFRTLAHQRLEPAQIATQLSAALLEEWQGALYVTCVVATLDLRARSLTYTSAGHPAGLLISANGIRLLNKGGPPVGLLADPHFDQEVVAVHSGDTCVLVTDGITEALEGTLAEDLVALPTTQQSASEVCASVMARALQGPGPAGDASWKDDRTVVVLIVRDSEAKASAATTYSPSATHSSLHDVAGVA